MRTSDSQKKHDNRGSPKIAMHEICELVEQSGNVASLPMSALREAVGRQRLTSGVVAEIAQTLAEHGLASCPETLPHDHRSVVRVYRLGTPVAEVFRTVTVPSEAFDEPLRRLVEMWSLFGKA